MAAAVRTGASWDFPRTAVASQHLIATALAHGVDAEAALEGTGLSMADLADPGVEVQARQELEIVRNLVAHVDDSASLGIETGLRYNLASTGILGYVLLTSPTVRDAVALGRRFAELSSTFLDIAVDESVGGLVLTLDASQIPDDVRRFLVARDFAAIAQIAPLLIGVHAKDAKATVELESTDMPIEFLNALDLPITITGGASHNRITMPNEVLDQPMPAADPATAAMCIAQCEEVLQRRRHRGGFSAQLRARLLEDPANIPSMAAVARELAVTERTLHRRLAAENTSFRALVDEIRETLAVELLGSDLTVEEVSRRLGYSEAAAFTHAFIRWRGHPPSQLSRRRS